MVVFSFSCQWSVTGQNWRNQQPQIISRAHHLGRRSVFTKWFVTTLFSEGYGPQRFWFVRENKILIQKNKMWLGVYWGKDIYFMVLFFFLKFELQRHFQIQNLVPISKQPNRNYNYSTVAGWNIIDCVFQIPLPTPTPPKSTLTRQFLYVSLYSSVLHLLLLLYGQWRNQKGSKAPQDLQMPG